MKSCKLLFILIFLTFQVQPLFADWMSHADFTTCPRQYFPNLSGEEGPFKTEGECWGRVEKAKRESPTVCVKYSCVEKTAGTTSSTGSAAPGHEMDQHIGTAISAGMNGQISGADAVGLVGLGVLGNALLSANAANNAPLTPEQLAARAEQERIWAEQRARAEAEAQQKEASYQAGQDAKSLALLEVAKNEFMPPSFKAPDKAADLSGVYSKGFEHATSCISQNSGTACVGASAEQQAGCIADYRAGYDAGNKKRGFIMDEAFQSGRNAAAKGELSNGASHPDAATNGCRTDWLQSYNRGYFEGKRGKHPASGKK